MYFLIDGLLFLWYQQWDYLCIVMYFLIDGLFFYGTNNEIIYA
jgi:hypothetical protein